PSALPECRWLHRAKDVARRCAATCHSKRANNHGNHAVEPDVHNQTGRATAAAKELQASNCDRGISKDNRSNAENPGSKRRERHSWQRKEGLSSRPAACARSSTTVPGIGKRQAG